LKELADRLVALVVLIGLSPLLALVAIAIRLDSPGSPVFCQERLGKAGRPFTVFKFRTMHTNNDDGQYKAYLGEYIRSNAPFRVDEDGQPVYKVVDDPRVTRLGRLLRRTNLDEFPQFVNVLRGEMSVVGPRPDIPFAVEMYEERHRQRLGAKPGITGLWQVYGRKNLSFEEMVSIDIDYISRQSLLLDARILLRTALVILGRDGS
jgi:lipopolysaccharide/colanic/teichoic acid biosynthesis glycosyltransferase